MSGVGIHHIPGTRVDLAPPAFHVVHRSRQPRTSIRSPRVVLGTMTGGI